MRVAYASCMYIFVSFFRWVENKKASDSLIEVWDNVKKMVAFWEGFPKSKRPSLKSYLAVKDSIGDPLFIAKLQFFSFVSKIVESFLKKCKTDQPMIPFLYCELKDIVNKLLDIMWNIKLLRNAKMEIDLATVDGNRSGQRRKTSQC